MDPKNPDVLFAATHQRQRRYFGMIHGGPESALWRSIDAGKTWTKVGGGIPNMGELGRIGLNYAPSNPIDDVRAGGRPRRPRRAVSLHRQRRHLGEAQQLRRAGPVLRQGSQVDPGNPDRVYIMNMNIMVSDDGGRTQTSLPTRYKHVDNHEIWVDPHNNDHYLVGCDGGVYESFDRAADLDLQIEPAHRADVRRGRQ